MCGIIAVVRQPVERVDLDAGPIVDGLDRAVALLRDATGDPRTAVIAEAADELEVVAARLHGPRGVRFLLVDQAGGARVRGLTSTLAAAVVELDRALDDLVVDDETEARNAAAVRCRDAAWAIERDRLRTADGVGSLIGRQTGWSAIEACTELWAARWIRPSGRAACSAAPRLAASVTSTSRSVAVTSAPASRNRGNRCPPTNPAAPVTKTRMARQAARWAGAVQCGAQRELAPSAAESRGTRISAIAPRGSLGTRTIDPACASTISLQ